MKKQRLPLKINPIKSTQMGLDFDGIIPQKMLVRLAEAADDILSDAHACFSCKKDEQGLVVLTGKVSANVKLCCQRCNNLFDQTLEVEFNLTPVASLEKIENLPDYYDPIEFDEFGEVDLISILEDELILTIPLVPLHALDDCGVNNTNYSFGEIEVEEKPNPFSILAQLKHNK